MIQYDHLLEIPFKHGRQDCYSLVRAFYKDNFDIEMTNYARPEGWWFTDDVHLYLRRFREEGFELMDIHPHEAKIADLIIMSIDAPGVANHGAIFVGEGKIIHHLYGRLSSKELYRGAYRKATVAIARHKTLLSWEPERIDLPLESVLSAHFMRKHADAGNAAGAVQT